MGRMSGGQVGFQCLWTVLFVSFFLQIIPVSRPLHAQEEDEEQSPRTRRIENLFDRFHGEDIPRTVFMYELDQMTGPLLESVRPLLREDQKKLEGILDSERLQNEVLPDLRERHKTLRNQVLSLILKKEKYNERPGNENYRQEVWHLERELLTLHRQPFPYFIQNMTELTYHFKRARFFYRYLENRGEIGGEGGQEEPEGQSMSNPGELRQQLERASQIVHPDSVGLSGEIQPHREYNRSTFRSNEERMQGWSAREKRLVRAVNRYREMMGLRRLLAEARLRKAARSHSEEMQRRGYFSHFSPLEENRTVSDRVRNTGFQIDVVGENIAEGDHSPAEVVREWRRSPPHHRNMVRGDYRFIGAGVYEIKWTVVMGNPSRQVPDSPGEEEGRPR